MKLLRLGPIGREKPVVEVEGIAYDLSSVTDDIDGAFLSQGDLSSVVGAALAAGLPELERAGELRVGAPIARPTAVLCIGQNYAAHAAESGSQPPSVPVLFHKHPNTVVGAYDDVPIPRGSEKTDWEVELAVVIGRRARYLDSPEDALAHIAGYTISNDVSERDFQREQSGGQWSKGKNCEGFNPLGPALITVDEVADPQALRLWSTVNGEPRQDSSTADMIFSVAHIIWHLSQYMVLEPGDLINTGTPQGVAMSGNFPYLKAGDEMVLGIDSLGEQRQKLVPAS